MDTAKNLEWFASLPVNRADEIKLDIAVEFDRALRAQNKTRKEFSQKLGVSPAMITKVLRGDANLTIDTMVKLAEAAGCHLDIKLRRPAEAEKSSFQDSWGSNVLDFQRIKSAAFVDKKPKSIDSTLTHSSKNYHAA